MNYCIKCGAQNSDDAVICTNCGEALANVPNHNAVPANGTAGKGFAIAGMVCGIVSFFCFGIVLGAIGLGLYLIMLIACGSMIPFMDPSLYY